MREVFKIQSILTQLVVEYDTTVEWKRDWHARLNRGWSPVGSSWFQNGKRYMKFTKLEDKKL